MKSNYTFSAALYNSGGERILQRPLDPDDEPLRQALAFARLRRSGQLPEFAAPVTVTPLWHESGQPRVGGVTVTDDDSAISIGTEFFTGSVRSVIKDLTAAKEVAADAVSHFQILAHPRSPKKVLREEIESDIADSVPPLVEGKLTAIRAKSVAHDESHQQEADPPVLIHRRIVEQAERLTHAADDLETGGVLIGHLHRDAAAELIALEITALIPARETRATSATLTFTPETWAAVDAALTLRRAGEQVLGWFHSHPVFAWKDICVNCGPEKRATCALRKPFLSQDDLVLHRAIFFRTFMVALLCSRDTKIDTALFGWRDGIVHRRAFHVIEP